MAKRPSKIAEARVIARRDIEGRIAGKSIRTGKKDGDTYVLLECWKCGGTGRYAHFGGCFACRGSGGEWVEVERYIERVARRMVRDEKKQKEREVEAREAEIRREAYEREFSSRYPTEWAVLEAWMEAPPRNREFLGSLYGQVRRKGTLSEKQLAALQRSIERGRQFEVERARKAEVSKFIGEAGTRYDFVLKINKTLDFESDFGISTLHIMEDDDGNVFTWFSSSKSLDEGKWYPIRATVKKHTERDGVKQTQLTRGKVGDVVARNPRRNKPRKRRRR
jgi:hypothetical protein